MNQVKRLTQFLDIFQYDQKWNRKNNPIENLKGSILPVVITASFIIMIGIIIMRYLGVEIWRHDSIHYTLDSSWYEGNLKQEGRWLNYFLFDLLKLIPGQVAAIFNLLCLFLFGYFCSSPLFKDKFLPTIFGISLLMMPVLHAQNMWPNLALPACIFLPILYFLSKKIHPFLLFSLAAILYFGTLSHFYFLIPLIYLEDLHKSKSGQFRKDAKHVFGRIVLPFGLCFILGFLVANAIVMLKTGGGIEIGEWRKPTPAHDLTQLISNFMEINNRLFDFGAKLFSQVHFLVWIVFIPLILLSLDKKNVWVLFVLIMMFLAPFYTTLYHGVMISERTMLAAAIPFSAIFFLIPALRLQFNILHLILCLAFTFSFVRSSSNQLHIFAKITGYYKEQIQRVTANMNPEVYNEVLVFVENADVIQINKQIHEHYKYYFEWGETLDAVDRTVVTALRSLGYWNVYWFNDKKNIDDIKKQVQGNSTKDPFIVISIDGKPSSFGIVINNTTPDVNVLDKL